jgi:hypothetical protein
MANFTPRPIDITSSAARFPEPPQINMSRIKVSGIGGLGMLGMAVVMAVALPEVRVFVVLSLIVGTLTGLALIRYRSTRGPWGPDDREHPLFDGHEGRAPGPDAPARPRIAGAASTLSGLWPVSHWRSWRRLPRGPVSCTN